MTMRSKPGCADWMKNTSEHRLRQRAAVNHHRQRTDARTPRHQGPLTGTSGFGRRRHGCDAELLNHARYRHQEQEARSALVFTDGVKFGVPSAVRAADTMNQAPPFSAACAAATTAKCVDYPTQQTATIYPRAPAHISRKQWLYPNPLYIGKSKEIRYLTASSSRQ